MLRVFFVQPLTWCLTHWEKSDPQHFAVRQYKKYKMEEGKIPKTISGFYSSFCKNVRPSVKYQAIHKNKDSYRISFLCRFFRMSRSGYYKWLKQKDRPDTLITQLIEMAKRQIQKGTLIDSDQGGQYSSKEYFLLSERHAFIPSMSRKATPMDNACAEGCFRTLKTGMHIPSHNRDNRWCKEAGSFLYLLL